MQEQSTPAPTPANNLAKLEPIILLDLVDYFKQSIITPIGHDIFIQCLKLALKCQADAIIAYLSECPLSPADGNRQKIKDWVIGKHGKQLFNLIYFEYAEYFRSTSQLQIIRSKLANKIIISKNKALLFAVISGDTATLKAAAEIPERPSSGFQLFMLYAAANNQAEVVRYLHERHGDFMHNAMAEAMKSNSSRVFDYLLNVALTFGDDFWQSLIHKALPYLFNKINLHLLLALNYNDKMPKLLGIYLHKLTNNTPRRLLIIAHILTYFSASIAQPTQVKRIFERALIELSNIEYNESNNFNEVIQTHYKKILISILRIRLELVKLMNVSYTELEFEIKQLDTTNEKDFLVQFDAITKQMKQHQIQLSINYLDCIEQDCITRIIPLWNPDLPENLILKDPDIDLFNLNP